MRPDPRLTVAFCLSANLVVGMSRVDLALTTKALVAAGFVLAAIRRPRLLLLALFLDALIAGVLLLLSVWAEEPLSGAVLGYLRWTVMMLAALLLFAGVGPENLLRVFASVRLPRVLMYPLGFAMRSLPLVQDEMRQSRRIARARWEISGRRPRLRERFGAVEHLAGRTLRRFHHVVSQIERRGFSPVVFGSLPPLSFRGWNLAAALPTLAIVGLFVWGLVRS